MTQKLKYFISKDLLYKKSERILFNIWYQNLKNQRCKNKKLWNVLKYDDIWINSFFKVVNSQKLSLFNIKKIHKINFFFNIIRIVKKTVLKKNFCWKNRRKNMLICNTRSKNLNFLTIPNFKNRLVQEIIKKILSSVYEPCFSSHSHGFFSGKSCHTALTDLCKNFKKCNWILKNEISSFINNKISQTKLIFLLQRKIKSKCLISIIFKGFKAKVLAINNCILQNKLLNSILFNIYLNKLDFNINVYYKNIRKFYVLRKSTCVKYIRYGNNFILGFNSYRFKVFEFKNYIKFFLTKQLNLKLNSSKILSLVKTTQNKFFTIVNPVYFLGYFISTHSTVINQNAKNKIVLTEKNSIVLKVFQREVVYKLANKGFCTKKGFPKVKFDYVLINQVITNERINQIFQNILNYYKFAINKKHLKCKLFFIFTHSLAKTYAIKYKLYKKTIVFDKISCNLNKQFPYIEYFQKNFFKYKQDLDTISFKKIINLNNKIKIKQFTKIFLNKYFIVSFYDTYKNKLKKIKTIRELFKKYIY